MRFKKDREGNPISFLKYLETKFMEFIKRPIGNQDRKIIIKELFDQGFFRDAEREMFTTANDGEVFTDAEFNALVTTGSTGVMRHDDVFKEPSGVGLSAREVALLDPFHVREIKIPPHPLENEIREFTTVYHEFCRACNVRPVAFSPHNIESKKAAIAEMFPGNQGKRIA